MMPSVFIRLALSMAYSACGSGMTWPQPAPTKAGDAAIQLRPLDARNVVYRAHQGAYWTIGPVVREVRAYMVQHNQPGPLFVRYLTDPRRGGASLETEIGFIVHGEHEPASSFQTTTWPAQRVASLAIEGRSPAPNRDYAVLLGWVEEQGLLAAGPVTELYNGDRSAASRSVDIQVAVLEASAIARQNETVAEMKDGNKKIATPVAAPSRPSHDASQTTAPTEHRTEPPPPSATAVASPPSEELPPAEPADAAPSLVEAETVESLVAAERFDEAAKVLLPDGRAINPALLPWIENAFARLHAAARGIRRVYPGEGAVMLKMADALMHRLTDVSRRGAEPGSGIGFQAFPNQRDQQPKRQRIIRDLDVLLSRIALRITKPAAAAEAMTKAVREIDQVIHNRPGHDKRGNP